MDLISDMLTRIRNASAIDKKKVVVLYSKLNLAILYVLKDEGYIEEYSDRDVAPGIKKIDVFLKDSSSSVIREIKRVSKSSRRVYSSVQELPLLCNGLGIYIVSTSKGVMSDLQARQNNVAGEIICSVF